MKIFGLGLSRTGTSSLSGALTLLGFRCIHYPPVHSRFARFGRFGALLGLGELHLDPTALARYDSLTDISVLPFYKQLDVAFPGSKFILTAREKTSWLKSCENFPKFASPTHATPWERVVRTLVYGTEAFDRDAFADAYDRHHADVHAHFQGREQDLLVLDICGGQGWERLCPFLGLDAPETPFPRDNVADAGQPGRWRRGSYLETHERSARKAIAALERSPPPGPELAVRARGELEFALGLQALERGESEAFTNAAARACQLLPELSTQPDVLIFRLHDHIRTEQRNQVVQFITSAALAWPERQSRAAAGLRLYAARLALQGGRVGLTRDLLRGMQVGDVLPALVETVRRRGRLTQRPVRVSARANSH